ncbi:MAG: alpha-2-macroglobulin family protein [Candidatus Hodarchaeales archaeon]
MTKLYTRIPKYLSSKGTIYRLFNATEQKLKIDEKDKSKQFTLNNRKTITKFLSGDHVGSLSWVIPDKERNQYDKLELTPLQFSEDFLGAVWIPKNQYRPGDSITGYVFLRNRPVKGNPLISTCSHDDNSPFILEVQDSSENTIKAIPFEKPEEPILFFEAEIDKYHPTGDYKLILKRGKDILFTQEFELAHYDKPDMQAFLKGPVWRLVGDIINVSLDAKYFHGEPVSVADVTLQCSALDEPIKGKLTNGSLDLEIPFLPIGSWELNATISDDSNREASASHSIVIAEEPIQLSFSMSPTTRPVVEQQPIQFRLQVNDPTGKPASGIDFKCSLLRNQTEECFETLKYSTDTYGYINIDVPSLKPGSYEFIARSTNTDISLAVTESFNVRNSTTEDFWIAIKGVPAVAEGDQKISGIIVLSGAGIQLNESNKVFLDIIADSILESIELSYKASPLIKSIEIPFSVDLPGSYFGQIVLEAYLDPTVGAQFEQKVENPSLTYEGEAYSFPRTSFKTNVNLQIEPPQLNIQLELPEEVATGTDFDINVKRNSETINNDVWLALALTDERVLVNFQPVTLKKTFYNPMDATEVLTLGSKTFSHYVPLPTSAPAGMPRPMMARAGGRGFGRGILRRAVKKQKSGAPFAMLEGLDEMGGFGLEAEESMALEDALDMKSEEETLPTQVIRTEFPEDIVLKPKLMPEDKITVSIKSPDSITTYRVFGIVCTTTHFGVAEKQVLVRNPVFTATQNPPEMILGDQVDIPTIIENLSKVTLDNLKIRATPNDCLQLLENPIIDIGRLKGRDRLTVFWPIEAIKVGDAQFTTSLESNKFSEISELQKPLYISPPGVPHPTFYRTSLEGGKSWIQNIEVVGNEAFILGIINFMPGVDLAVLEGVESLASYPYGCCEQTSATTIPNAVAYQYLENNQKLTDELKNTLITNMKAGLERYRTNFRNKDNGGFGLWSGEDPSVFHTSLAISVIGKISPYIDVPDEIFTGAQSYLASQQNKDGSYEPSSGVHQNFPATLTKLANTGFVAHSQALGGVVDEKAVQWLVHGDQRSELLKDDTVLALVVDILGMLKSQLSEDLKDQLKELVQELIKCSKTDEKGSFWVKGSSLSSEVETTAYALTALAHSEIISSDIMQLYESGTNFLLNTRTSSGWFTTRDTLWACMALGEIASKLNQGGVDGTLHVKLNGELIKSVDITPENKYYRIYDLRNIFLDQFVHGDNKVELSLEGAGAGHVVLELRKWYATKTREVAEVKINQKVQTTHKINNPINIDYTLESKDPLEAVIIEQPIPAGCEVPDETLEKLRKVEGVNHVEINNNKVAFFFTELKDSTFRIDLIPSLSGKIQLDGLRVMPMYQPDQTTSAQTTWLELKK